MLYIRILMSRLRHTTHTQSLLPFWDEVLKELKPESKPPEHTLAAAAIIHEPDALSDRDKSFHHQPKDVSASQLPKMVT